MPKKTKITNVKDAQREMDDLYAHVYDDCTTIDDELNIYLSVLPETYQKRIDDLKRVIEGKYDLSYNELEPTSLQKIDTKEQVDEKKATALKSKTDKMEKLLNNIKKTEETLAKYKKQLADMQ
jgi:hypothetical protein